MCLQWCHATQRLIDNDLPCTWCARFPQSAPQLERTCASCSHLAERNDRPPFCGLSRAGLPLVHACCHWNATLTCGPLLHIGPANVAPGVLEAWCAPSVAALFERAEGAPGHAVDEGGHVTVALADLALPLVYGVAAGGWSDALGDGAVEASGASASPAPLEIGPLVVGLLDALDQGGDREQAHSHAARLLALLAQDDPPAPWPALAAEALRLYGERRARPETQP
jgi:hypothetical protein